jgi:lysozyme
VNISPAGVHLIASFEGFLPNWYRDVGGVETIGYGHTGPLPVGVNPPLTGAAGLAVLHSDAQVAVRAVNQAVKVKLGTLEPHAQARFDALVSLTFNIGGGAFAASSLLHAINEKPAPRDWTPLGPLWIEWDHVNGQVVQGLLNRRREEFEIFRTGTYPT